MKNTAITWCIENCAGYMAHEAANDEMNDIAENFERMESTITEQAAEIAQLRSVIAKGQSLLRSTQLNWREDCLFECDRLFSETLAPPPAAQPTPEPETPRPLSDEEFKSLWQKVNSHVATIWDIQMYRNELDRRATALSDTATSGRDEREGKK